MLIIKSLIDNDLYKFTQQKAVLAYKQDVPVTYAFNNRRKSNVFNDAFMDAFHDELWDMDCLQASDEQIKYFQERCPFLGRDYFEYLRNYRFNPDEVTAKLDASGQLDLKIAGTWDRTILWEVPLMALISELYFIHCDTNWNHSMTAQEIKLHEKAKKLEGINFTDFGTRRRRNFETQELVVSTFSQLSPTFMGTSNVHLAHQYNVRPIGTMAHEWIMAISVLEGLLHANRHAMKIWSDIYHGDLGTALPDTFGTDAFWADFDGYLARLFDGPRHDSGCPFKFADKTIANYQRLRINPLSKTAIFSDGLDCDLARKIHDYCENKLGNAFGIGTHFTNDYLTLLGEISQALNMVIKLSTCNGKHVVKLGDGKGKEIGDRDAVRVAKHTFFNQPLDSDGNNE